MVHGYNSPIEGDENTPLLRQDTLEDDVAKLPQVIRETVPLSDDPTIPVLTFRYFLLSFIFIIPGAFIDTLSSYRTTSVPYSIYFVQIVGHWAGLFLARTLPHKRVNIFNLFSFDLNPGPWSVKETALVMITAKSGATGNLATNALSMAELYFNERMSPLLALTFMWAIVFIGYSYSIIARNFVLYDPQLPWPQALMQTTLLQTQAKPKNGSSQMSVFFWALSIVAIWQLFPEYIFPLTSSLAVLCWIAPHNKTVNFIGSGMGGMGVANLSLDWANISSSIMLYPYWIQVIQFVAFVFGAWFLIPLAKWSNIFLFKHGLMSNKIFLNNGTVYPIDEIITPDFQLNITAYEYYGPVNLGMQRAWNMFFDYAAYFSGIIWICLFGYENFKKSSIFNSRSTIRTDRLNKLHRQYKDVPISWYMLLLFVSLMALMLLYANGKLFMPVWCCMVGLILGSIIVTPLIWLYAISNFQLPIGTFNELLYGYMVQSQPRKHGAGAAFYGSLSGNAWYRAQYHLESMRLGFYNHLPPRAVFMSQIIGELIGVPFNYLALRWVLNTKREYLDGTKIDPLHQWTGQAITTLHTNAVQYVILGPSRLFVNYPILPYGFLLGIVAPLVVFGLHRRYPTSALQFHHWNTTIFFSSMARFYGNISTGYLSQFIGGTFTMFYAFKYKHHLWRKYNYILAAAFDTGLNLSILVIFILSWLDIRIPYWWGNNSQSIERCFAL